MLRDCRFGGTEHSLLDDVIGHCVYDPLIRHAIPTHARVLSRYRNEISNPLLTLSDTLLLSGTCPLALGNSLSEQRLYLAFLAMQYLASVTTASRGGANMNDESDFFSSISKNGMVGRQVMERAFMSLSRRVVSDKDDTLLNANAPVPALSKAGDEPSSEQLTLNRESTITLSKEATSTDNLSGSWVFASSSLTELSARSIRLDDTSGRGNLDNYEGIPRLIDSNFHSDLTDTNTNELNTFSFSSLDEIESSYNYSILNEGMSIEDSFILLGSPDRISQDKVATSANVGLPLDWHYRFALKSSHNTDFAQHSGPLELGDRVYRQRNTQVIQDSIEPTEKTSYDSNLITHHSRPIRDFKSKVGGRLKTAKAKFRYSKFNKF